MIETILVGLAASFAAALVIGFVFERFSEWRDLRRFPPPGDMVDVGASALHLYCLGEAGGPTIVIEQGAGSPSIFWWPIQRALAGSARICTYDRAGYLWSPSLGKGRSVTARVDDLRALLVNSALPGPFVMAGHSYGGLIIAQLARRHPELVAGLVFIDTPDERVIYDGRYLAQSKSLLTVVRVMSLAARCGVLRLFNPMLAGLPGQFTGAERAALASLASRPQFLAAMVDDFESMNRASAAEKTSPAPGSLGAIPISVVSHGVPFPPPYDALNEGWEEGQARLAALSSNSEVVIAGNSSHMIQFEQPDVVIDAIARVHAAARSGTRLARTG
jgi:pimeloyl-ACP methyl ester carboxylesterase